MINKIESQENTSPRLEQIKDTIAETMEKLAAVLDRTIDSMWAYGIKIAEQIKQLGEKFKDFLLADKEIILHSNMKNILQEINNALDQWDAELINNPKKLYGMLQEVDDLIAGRMTNDSSYKKNFSWLYTEDIKPQITAAIAKLRIAA